MSEVSSQPCDSPRLRVVGYGRAGAAMSLALERAGWRVLPPIRRGDDPHRGAEGADLVLIATPDAAISEVASALQPEPRAVVAHMAGSLGLEVLAGHQRRAAIHPLVSLPSGELGSERLVGAWFALAGDPIGERVVGDLGGRWLQIDDANRAAYHAAGCIASNHLVALLGQVERVAATAGVPLEPYLALVRSTVENVAAVGPAAAITGPASRGDVETLQRHRRSLPASELPAYDALADEARRLASQRDSQ